MALLRPWQLNVDIVSTSIIKKRKKEKNNEIATETEKGLDNFLLSRSMKQQYFLQLCSAAYQSLKL